MPRRTLPGYRSEVEAHASPELVAGLKQLAVRIGADPERFMHLAAAQTLIETDAFLTLRAELEDRGRSRDRAEREAAARLGLSGRARTLRRRLQRWREDLEDPDPWGVT